MYLYHEYQAGWASHLPATSTAAILSEPSPRAFAAGCMPGMLDLILYHPSIQSAPSCREMFFTCCWIYREEGTAFPALRSDDKTTGHRRADAHDRGHVPEQGEVERRECPAFYHSVWQAVNAAVVFLRSRANWRTPSACPTVAA